MMGEIFGYWEQGWEGRIAFAFQPDDKPAPVFLRTGQTLTLFDSSSQVLWSGAVDLVPRRWRDQHALPAAIWSYEKQRNVPYAQWMAWFWSTPRLRARLETVGEDDHGSLAPFPA